MNDSLTGAHANSKLRQAALGPGAEVTRTFRSSFLAPLAPTPPPPAWEALFKFPASRS